jgi:hypothetical protein
LQWRSPSSLRSRRGRPPEFPRAIRLRRSHRFTGLTTRSCTSTPETAGFATAPKSLCVQLMECRARPAHRIFGPGNACPHGIEAHQIPMFPQSFLAMPLLAKVYLGRTGSPIFPCPLVVLNESPGPRMPGLCGQLSAHFMRGCRRAPLFFIQRCAKLLTRHEKSWPGSDQLPPIRVVIAILGTGHFFGEGRLNGHPLRIATTRAVDECVITRLEARGGA